MKVNEAQESLKLLKWKRQIEECKNSGLSVTQWCRDNNINIQKYYYRLSRVRENTCGKAEKIEQSIVPLNIPVLENISAPEITIEAAGIRISIPQGVSSEIIEQIIRALKC